ncbi:MAG: hypothetical protein V1909_05235, partial [Candidatus Micrarchaeota archaeon]
KEIQDLETKLGKAKKQLEELKPLEVKIRHSNLDGILPKLKKTLGDSKLRRELDSALDTGDAKIMFQAIMQVAGSHAEEVVAAMVRDTSDNTRMQQEANERYEQTRTSLLTTINGLEARLGAINMAVSICVGENEGLVKLKNRAGPNIGIEAIKAAVDSAGAQLSAWDRYVSWMAGQVTKNQDKKGMKKLIEQIELINGDLLKLNSKLTEAKNALNKGSEALDARLNDDKGISAKAVDCEKRTAQAIRKGIEVL